MAEVGPALTHSLSTGSAQTWRICNSAMKRTKKTTTETTTQTVVTESESESEPECSVTEQSGSESASENAPPSSSERGRSTDEDAPGETTTDSSGGQQQQKLKADVPIPDKKANSYPSALPGPHPRRPNYIEPIRAEVVQTERVIETPEDPSPNAYYDARNNIVRVYHGPVWGRSSSASNAGQFQSLYPRRDTSLRPLPMGVPHPMQNPYHHGFARPLSDGWDYAWQQQQHPMYYPPMENEAYLAPPHGAAAAATAPSPEPATNKGAFGVDAAVDDGMPRGYKIGKDNPYLLPKKSIFANRSPSSRSPRDMNDTAGAGTTVGGDSHGGPGQDGWGDAKSNRGPVSGWVDDDNIRQAGSGGWGDVNDDDNNNNNDQAGWADTNNDSNANQTGWGDANIDDDANDDDSNDPGNTWGSSTPAAVATDDDVHHMPGSWCDPTAAVATGGQVDAAVW
ncbi:hypothetical protein GMORB2_6745 [Geosmithia morbida]|uniref:Uncharacterized protein n=1 Tax=Geosmithia morbida TaxID=1094350 RepID=A0A9P4YUT1_9HYPO|nr:uncharacterized protein GMORB2_6745 [Geosmithia morbida]KAF4123195.1 hypothetical protein GMORB2_6745 [Geosmithia morbida]